MFSEMSAEGGQAEAIDLDPKNVAMMMSVMKMSMPLASGNAFRNSPPIIRESLLFPYLQGMVFVLNIMKERKFENCTPHLPGTTVEHRTNPSPRDIPEESRCPPSYRNPRSS